MRWLRFARRSKQLTYGIGGIVPDVVHLRIVLEEDGVSDEKTNFVDIQNDNFSVFVFGKKYAGFHDIMSLVMENEIISKWGTTVIATLGFALGVINYVTDLFRRRHRASVSVGNYIDSFGCIGLAVTVENTGETTFTVTGIAFKLKDRRQLWCAAMKGDMLPKVIHPGEHCQVVIPASSYLDPPRRDIKNVFARLPSGKEFHSKRLTNKFLRRVQN